MTVRTYLVVADTIECMKIFLLVLNVWLLRKKKDNKIYLMKHCDANSSFNRSLYEGAVPSLYPVPMNNVSVLENKEVLLNVKRKHTRQLPKLTAHSSS